MHDRDATEANLVALIQRAAEVARSRVKIGWQVNEEGRIDKGCDESPTHVRSFVN
jgi:hypothetical protein